MKFSIISKLVFALFLGHIGLQAQSLISIDGAVAFPATNEIQASSETIRLFNPNSYPISISSVDRFELYQNKVFSVSDSQFTLMPGDTFSLAVSFLPEHNIQHQQIIVLRSDNGFGHTAIALSGQGSYSLAYYSSTENKSQEQLKNALSSRLALGYNDLGYSGARDQMYASIDNNGGQVECVYTGRTATFNTRSGANNNSFNCEHTFPQGFFNSNVPMRSDIHHLFPTDVTANSRRGNDPFGVVSSASWSQGGSKSGGGKFEPRDVHKGAVARAMMYFVIRYQDYSNHFSGQENILRQWHQQYPPSASEKTRNAAIFNLQNNRNPFVDYPQFIERISDIDATASATALADLYRSDDTIKLASGPAMSRFYSFVLYNRGNESLDLTNFNLSDPNLSFRNGNPGNITLDEGDFYVIEIDFRADESYQANLTYEVSDGLGLQSVPISSGPQLSTPDYSRFELPQFYPNPSDGKLKINSHDLIERLYLVDVKGKQMELEVGPELDLSDLSPGVYIWKAILKKANTPVSGQIILR